MAKSLGGAVLGAIGTGIVCGFIAQYNPHDQFYYAGGILSGCIGLGFGAVAGAVVGGTSAILDAINRLNPPAIGRINQRAEP